MNKLKTLSASFFNLLALTLLLGLAVQSLRAQQQTRLPKKMPSAEKVVASYLKAIGGKKQVAAVRDVTYEFTIQLDDQPMGIAKTQLKTPASARTEMIFGNGQVTSAANARSAWLHGLDGKLHTLTDAEAGAAKLQAALDASRLLYKTIEWTDYRHFSGDVGDYKLDAPKSQADTGQKP